MPGKEKVDKGDAKVGDLVEHFRELYEVVEIVNISQDSTNPHPGMYREELHIESIEEDGKADVIRR